MDKVKGKTLAEATRELAEALRSFGASLEEATRITKILSKKVIEPISRHPFAKYFKAKRHGKNRY
jgi:hypothetical protein